MTLIFISEVSTEIIYGLLRATQQLIGFYEWVVVMRVILYWFPNFNPYDYPFVVFTYAALPFFKLFSNLLPIVFGLDLSLYVGFLFLEGLKQLVEKMMYII